MTALANINVRRGARPPERLPSGAPEIFVNFRGDGGGVAPTIDPAWLPPSLPAPAWSDARELEAPADAFAIATIRPGREHAPPKGEGSERARRPWGAAVLSGGLHLALLAALLTWATPVAEPASPEPVTVDIVADMPAPAVNEAPAAPAPSAVDPSPPPAVVEPPPPVAEAPPPPPVAEPAPPVADAPPAPPPPVVEPPPPVAEPPPPPPQQRLPPVASALRPAVSKPPPATQRATPRPTSPESAPSTSHATRPASTPAPAAAPAVSSADAAAYQAAVLGRIAAQKRYPEAARERAPHGVAVVSFSIGASGQLAGASLSQSAGDPLLDAEALATVRRASPFPPPPAGAPRNFSAPLSYRVR